MCQIAIELSRCENAGMKTDIRIGVDTPGVDLARKRSGAGAHSLS
jgi:hypothetical protein